jgi:orotate phosphoribosyltransferase
VNFREELAKDLVDVALLHGDFVLSSGARSNYYFDKYLFETRPKILRRVAKLLADQVPEDIDMLAGPELGGVALATAVSLETDLPFVIVRKQSKEYGTSRAIEGTLAKTDRVLIVEDVVTSGGESIRSARQVAEAGATVVGVLAVLDREQGGANNIRAAGFKFDALFTRTELNLQ